MISVIGLVLLLATGCGKNNGTPMPDRKDPPSADADREVDGASMQLAASQHWRAEIRWNLSPAYNEEEFLEMTGVVYIRNVDGQVPESVSELKFTADMPQCGHGTGNILPEIVSVAGTPGAYAFRNLFFTMNGLWRIQVSGIVDGQFDVWTAMVDVR
jgi:hypothetical protein